MSKVIQIKDTDIHYSMEDMRSYAKACLAKAAENAQVVVIGANGIEVSRGSYYKAETDDNLQYYFSPLKESITSDDNLI